MTTTPAELGTSHLERAQVPIKAMEEIFQEKEAVLAREREALQGLNTVLNKMGYKIVPVHQDAPKRRGRLPGSEAGADEIGGPQPKRRGRPPVVKTEGMS